MNCPKCGSKLALAKIFCNAEWNEEPYEEGKQESVKTKDGYILENPNIFLNITINICPDCKYADIGIEESNCNIGKLWKN